MLSAVWAHVREFLEFLDIKAEWVLGIATVLLWIATVRLVGVGKRTAVRQLRAYVLVEKAIVFAAAQDGRPLVLGSDTGHGGELAPIQPGYQPMATFHFKNFGQTPAHDVQMFGNVAIVSWPIKPKDLPALDMGVGSREIVGPGGTRQKHELFAQAITPQEWTGLTNGTLALVFFGEVRYLDAFEKKRITQYRYFTGGEMGIRGRELSSHHEGNSYT
jgi:hypothetical protein